MNRRPIFALLALVFAIVLPRGARAEGLEVGHYHFSAPLGPLCLDGAYPFVVGDVPGGILSVTTSPTGKLTGEIELWGEKQPVTGTIKARPNYVRLTIKGRDSRGRLSIKGKLQGGAFVGTAVTKKGKASCSLDVTATAPLAAVFDFDIALNAKGRLRGTGTLSACGQALPIAVVASNSAKQSSKLRLSAGKQSWQGAGLSLDGGFVAKWQAQGFGALTKGNGLSVVVD